MAFHRNYFETTDLVKYFDNLKRLDHMPSFTVLVGTAKVLGKRHATSKAYEQAIKPTEHEPAAEDVPLGSPWQPQHAAAVDTDDNTMDVDADRDAASSDAMDVDQDGPDLEDNLSAFSNDSQCPGADQPDVTLANSTLFIRNSIWWREVCEAIADGDTGRVWEILKVRNCIEQYGTFNLPFLGVDLHVHGQRQPVLRPVLAGTVLHVQMGPLPSPS